MQFPVINHIDDVLWAIAGRDEFIVAERDGYKIVNYLVNFADTFPDLEDCQTDEEVRLTLIRRECRGIIFDATGNIISRPYHKFFNALERKETSLTRIDVNKPHVVLEKLDGSFIRPFIVNGELLLGTKMGATDIAKTVWSFVDKNPQYRAFMMHHCQMGYTPIFEWCSRSQRIVIDYPEDRLVLTGLRHMITGTYVVYDQLVRIAQDHKIDCVKALDASVEDFQAFVAFTRQLEGLEGYVVRFEDGTMYKVKGEHYMNLHHTKDLCGLEKNALFWSYRISLTIATRFFQRMTLPVCVRITMVSLRA